MVTAVLDGNKNRIKNVVKKLLEFLNRVSVRGVWTECSNACSVNVLVLRDPSVCEFGRCIKWGLFKEVKIKFRKWVHVLGPAPLRAYALFVDTCTPVGDGGQNDVYNASSRK